MIDGTVTMSITDYEYLKKIHARWEESLRVADELRRLNKTISASGYELDQKTIFNEIRKCEKILRGM